MNLTKDGCSFCYGQRLTHPELKISGRVYHPDPELWHSLEGHQSVSGRCNGCGPNGHPLLSWLIKDKWLGVHLDPACAIHDHQCSIGGDRLQFLETSQVFARNIERCLRFGGVKRSARPVGWVYAFAVHVFGVSAFSWEAKATGFFTRLRQSLML